MGDGSERGMPGEFLLLFTLLLWILFLMVYLGNRKSKLNKWFFICGFLFSIGVFKEYLYYSLFPQLMAMPMPVMSESAAETIYSVMTAVPYYFATPAMLVTGLYFSRMEKRRPGLFPWITLISFLPGIVMSIVYPITRTRYFQLNDRTYYTIISIYNVAVALTATFFFLNALIKERNPKVKRQKLAIAVLALVPSWFTIMSTIPIQLFSVEGAEKAWQGNLIIIIVLVGMYFVLVFKEGFMGSRLRHETYRWDQDEKLVEQTIDTVRHMIKNQTAKINWCAANMSSGAGEKEIQEYAGIILRATRRISDFLNISIKGGSEFKCTPEVVDVYSLLNGAAADFKKRYPNVSIRILCQQGSEVFCDETLVREVLQNLFQNSVEAMGEEGTIDVEFKERRRGFLHLKISDTGQGLPDNIRENIFLPYVSSKNGEKHWGIGLYYCQKAMAAHGGMIKADNRPGGGAVFTLYFPKKKKGMLNHGSRKI